MAIYIFKFKKKKNNKNVDIYKLKFQLVHEVSLYYVNLKVYIEITYFLSIFQKNKKIFNLEKFLKKNIYIYINK